MNLAVRVWEDNFKILNKIRSKSERNALCFALIYYGFYGEVPQDLKLNENNLLIFEVLKNNFIAKNQGGAPVGNFNRCSTVEKNKSTDNQPLSENRKQKTENINIPPDNNKLLSSPQGDKDSADAPNLSDEKKYAFEGKIIKLNQKDFNRWKQAYPDLNLWGELMLRDDWLVKQPPDKVKDWFISTSTYFLKQNELRKRQNADLDEQFDEPKTSIFDDEPKKTHDWSWV